MNLYLLREQIIESLRGVLLLLKAMYQEDGENYVARELMI
jgi:hypothetical protein